MLPQNNSPPGKIFVNPNFKGTLYQDGASNFLRIITPSPSPSPNLPRTAHINPLFLTKQKRTCVPKTHVNPMFLAKLHEQRQQQLTAKTASIITNTANASSSPTNKKVTTQMHPVGNRKIICKSKNRLILEPARPNPEETTTLVNSPKVEPQKFVTINRKIVRNPVNSSEVVLNVIKPHAGPVVSKVSKTKYKLDNRVSRTKAFDPFSVKMKRKSFVGPYALRRTLSNQHTVKTNVIKSNNSQSNNKKLQLLNINGLLYKSTRNKLQLKDSVIKDEDFSKPASVPTTKNSQGLRIFIKGSKYLMDDQKFKLTRVPTIDTSMSTGSSSSDISRTRSRIDIGGFTYVSAPNSKNVLIRTTNHLARAYVHNAKQKSVHLLTKHLVKSNIPCPIYQRLGKCAAFERGKCSKVHNKQQVAICSKFLRGECYNSNCLLSHDVSMSKMPVCKFFLQGVCVRNDCPYLHKKLSNNADVCLDFLRGFCKLADKCNKRHEFVCPELERTGSCSSKTCLYCKSRLKKKRIANRQLINEPHRKISLPTNETPEATPSVEASSANPAGKRYFVERTEKVSKSSIAINEDDMKETHGDGVIQKDLPKIEDEVTPNKRAKIDFLPAFIPLS